MAKRILEEDRDEEVSNKRARKISQLQEKLRRVEQEKQDAEIRRVELLDKRKKTMEQHTDLAESVVRDIKSQKVFSLSLDDNITLSPKVLTTLKQTIKEDEENQLSLLATRPITIPKSNGAPWVNGTINNLNVEIILDTGSTASIVSLACVRQLGLEDKLVKQQAVKRGMPIADGSTIYPIGILENVIVEISLRISRTLDALCLDVKSCDLILGRVDMA